MKVFAKHYFALALMGNLKGGLSPLSLGIKGINARYLGKVRKCIKTLPPNSLKSDSIEVFFIAPVKSNKTPS